MACAKVMRPHLVIVARLQSEDVGKGGILPECLPVIEYALQAPVAAFDPALVDVLLTYVLTRSEIWGGLTLRATSFRPWEIRVANHPPN